MSAIVHVGDCLEVMRGMPDASIHRVGQLRALGNAQVPQVAAAAFLELMGRLS